MDDVQSKEKMPTKSTQNWCFLQSVKMNSIEYSLNFIKFLYQRNQTRTLEMWNGDTNG